MSATALALVALTAVLTMSANLLLRAGIDAAGGFVFDGMAGAVRALAGLFMQPMFTAGFLLYFLASVVWFRIVAIAPLSLAYPTLVGLTFTLVTAGAVLVLGEPLSARKIAGLAVILAGISIVSLEPGLR